MPIGDLLAEISGKPSSPGSALPSSSSSSSAPAGVKRKASASSALASATVKKPAVEPSSLTTRPTPIAPRNNVGTANIRRADGLTGGASRSNGSNSIASRDGGSSVGQVRRNAHDVPRPRPVSNTKGASVVPARPSPPTTRPAPASNSAPPKKGSFAEIMARGAKAQQTMGKVGVIQHKAVDKPLMTKKERETAKAEQKNSAKAALHKGPAPAGKPSSMSTQHASRPTGSGRGNIKGGPSNDRPGPSRNGKAPLSATVPDKKVKKSTLATTGYAGTARPVPGAASRNAASRPGQSSRPGQRDRGLLAPPKASRRDKYEDDYDEDMDDFIDYDDEEEADAYGRRPGGYGDYDSDASSDMEAGMSDIDSEERAAERYARNEDKREQMLEEKLKREKEERKRRMAQGYR